MVDHQHSFRLGYSTTTVLNVLAQKISTGFNRPKPVDRTALVALDQTSAYNTVNISVLLEDIWASSITNSTKRRLCSYLRGHSTFVEFRGRRSTMRKVWQEVPQGWVLSLALLNTYMSSMPAPPQNIEMVSYADDITIMASGVKPVTLCGPVPAYLDELDHWMQERNLCLSAGKSQQPSSTNGQKRLGVN